MANPNHDEISCSEPVDSEGRRGYNIVVAAHFLSIDPDEPESWLVAQAVRVIEKGGLVALPTDTVYALACRISSKESIRKIYELKNLDPKKHLSILLPDLGTAGRYTRGLTTPIFRLMKRILPGGYTLIFQSSPEVPKTMLRKRKTIGVRMPDNQICLAILAEITEPLVTTSVQSPEDEYVVDPHHIEAMYGSSLDLIVDGGVLENNPSTIVDFSSGEAELMREGKGDVEALELFE